jgi:hypothetical protein
MAAESNQKEFNQGNSPTVALGCADPVAQTESHREMKSTNEETDPRSDTQPEQYKQARNLKSERTRGQKISVPSDR